MRRRLADVGAPPGNTQLSECKREARAPSLRFLHVLTQNASSPSEFGFPSGGRGSSSGDTAPSPSSSGLTGNQRLTPAEHRQPVELLAYSKLALAVCSRLTADFNGVIVSDIQPLFDLTADCRLAGQQCAATKPARQIEATETVNSCFINEARLKKTKQEVPPT